MNIQLLRQSLKHKWLSYYEQNIPWLVKMRIWGTYDGLRRPLSGFILATLSVLEPQFDETLSFMLDLNNNPDKIVAALGLNFNPDEELRLIKSEHSMAASESAYQKHCEDKLMSSFVTASKIAPHSNLPDSDQSVPSFTATTEVAQTQKPKLLVVFGTKIAPDTPVITSHSAKIPSSLLREHKPVQTPLERLSSGTLLTMTTEVNSKAKTKTMPSLALATEVSSNSKPMQSPSARLPLGALLAITTEINSNGKPVRSLAITTEVKSNGKHPNIQPQDVKSKVNLPTSNARSLASWVDEFCYGMRDKEEDILI
ncbi:MAG: DUF5331 domain-containing protein [Nostoc sp.]|uniref:DUF5331 domain-containing protein n=1 Tax=Nostoc sp. TaxID=1180 RepID=UPI0030375B3A